MSTMWECALWSCVSYSHKVRDSAANFTVSSSSDLLWISLPHPLPARSRVLRWGGEADGFCVRAASLQCLRSRDAHPARAHVPRGPPHVATTSLCCTNTNPQTTTSESPKRDCVPTESAFLTTMKPFPVSDFKAGVDPPADFHLGANAGSCIRPWSGSETEPAGQMEAPRCVRPVRHHFCTH